MRNSQVQIGIRWCQAFVLSASMMFVVGANAGIKDDNPGERDAYNEALLSPDGKHFALTAEVDKQINLLIFNIETMQVVSAFGTNRNQDILGFWWANNERVVVNMAIKNALVDYPVLKGELFALNIGNTLKFAVAGFSAGDKANYDFLDSNSVDDERIWVIRSDIRNRRLALSNPIAYSLDIYKRYKQDTGSSVLDSRLQDKFNSPYTSGGFVADNASVLRLAYSIDRKGFLNISHLDRERQDWVEVGSFPTDVSRKQQIDKNPIVGFDSANKGVFYFTKPEHGTNGLSYLDVQTGETRVLYQHPKIDISADDLIFSSGRDIVGVHLDGSNKPHFFSKHVEVPRLRGLANAFNGGRVDVLNYSKNGDMALLNVRGNGSGLYLFNAHDNSVSILMPGNS
ncbi:MAG: hypothetical protein ABGY96_20825 [bacterium]